MAEGRCWECQECVDELFDAEREVTHRKVTRTQTVQVCRWCLPVDQHDR